VKDELSTLEKRKERQARKRKIKSHLKKKEESKKEKRREQGIAQVDRFDAKHLKVAKGMAAGKEGGHVKPSKFFANMTEIAKADREKKEQKRSAKHSGPLHDNGNAKRFKL